MLQVSYVGLEVDCGTKMHRTEPYLKTAPTITYAQADNAKSYCLMMIDPDAPSHAAPTLSPIRHW